MLSMTATNVFGLCSVSRFFYSRVILTARMTNVLGLVQRISPGVIQTPNQTPRGNEKNAMWNQNSVYVIWLYPITCFSQTLFFSLFLYCSGGLVLFGCGIKIMAAPNCLCAHWSSFVFSESPIYIICRVYTCTLDGILAQLFFKTRHGNQ